MALVHPHRAVSAPGRLPTAPLDPVEFCLVGEVVTRAWGTPFGPDIPPGRLLCLGTDDQPHCSVRVDVRPGGNVVIVLLQPGDPSATVHFTVPPGGAVMLYVATAHRQFAAARNDFIPLQLPGVPLPYDPQEHDEVVPYETDVEGCFPPLTADDVVEDVLLNGPDLDPGIFGAPSTEALDEFVDETIHQRDCTDFVADGVTNDPDVADWFRAEWS